MSLAGRSLITLDDVSDTEIVALLDSADKILGTDAKPASRNDLADKVVATLFFEPSTRTRLSFETAAHRLGARVIGFSDPSGSSTIKGETLEDTVRTVAQYADCIVMRHPEPGSAQRAADTVDVPVINAGDGANAHPTQSLLDLYTIRRERHRIADNSVVFFGDLKWGRTVHSLAPLVARFGNKVTFVAAPGLEAPERVVAQCSEHGRPPQQTDDLKNAIRDADVLYVTRIQQERFVDPDEYARIKGSYVVDKGLVAHARDDLTILHPLPRVDEIAADVDELPNAAYFRQVAGGVPVRMAILDSILRS